jgi:hypothetical protein
MNRILAFLLIIFISSCTLQEEKISENEFFDIKGFFEAEAKRLTNLKSLSNKKVTQNNQSEIKNSLSVDWNSELALFVASDINKPAWRDSYSYSENNLRISYIAIDTNLRTRSVEIQKDKNGRTVFFKIKNIARNMLYESSEELTYILDSAYTIDKNQSVRFLGNNNYQIKGIISNGK